MQINVSRSDGSQGNHLYHDGIGSSNRFDIRLEGNIYKHIEIEKCLVPGLPLSVD